MAAAITPLSITIVLLAVFASGLGGILALRFAKYLHYFNAFAAGILLGAAFFEIIPEAAELAGDFHKISLVVVLGFLAFYILQRFTIIHACNSGGKHHDHDESVEGHTHSVGVIGALGLAAHRFLDGAAVGLGFAVDIRLGLAIGLAVIAHGFGDGISTVTVMLKHKNTRKKTMTLLAVSALAPLLGAVAAMAISVPEGALAVMLAFFAGFFLYMSTNDLLPEAHHENHSYAVLVATVAGVILLYIASGLV
jgi:zinc transporter ZupT